LEPREGEEEGEREREREEGEGKIIFHDLCFKNAPIFSWILWGPTMQKEAERQAKRSWNFCTLCKTFIYKRNQSF